VQPAFAGSSEAGIRSTLRSLIKLIQKSTKGGESEGKDWKSVGDALENPKGTDRSKKS